MDPRRLDTAEGILFTDLYQLTQAQLYLRMGLAERPAQFDHFTRSYPDYGNHQAGYLIVAGMEWLLDWMERAHFTASDLEYLRAQRGITGKRLFADDYLDWLAANGSFDGMTVDAIPEGRVGHANVPLTVVRGPLAMAQILETPLLNLLNYQTLVATKASRVAAAGRGRPVMEFGLRRGPERGANAGARAALIGGADFTSNVAMSRLMGVPPKGTHAHAMVQAFMALGEGELGAFRAYADVYPDDCLLLVDTIDTLESGIPNAITVFTELRRRGHEPVGIRLDSGDLAHLAVRAAQMLAAAGFPETTIVLSSGLDELSIWQILTQIEEEAPRYDMEADAVIDRLAYGVGTRLITSEGDPALDGVYKAVALEVEGEWRPLMKISENPEKTLVPGPKGVWRLYDERGRATADVLALRSEDLAAAGDLELFHPIVDDKHRTLPGTAISAREELLAPVLVAGERVSGPVPLEELRRRRAQDLDRLDPGVRRLINPHVYHVSLTAELRALKQELMRQAEGSLPTSGNRSISGPPVMGESTVGSSE